METSSSLRVLCDRARYLHRCGPCRDYLRGKKVDLLAMRAGGAAEEGERLVRSKGVTLCEDALCLLDCEPGAQCGAELVVLDLERAHDLTRVRRRGWGEGVYGRISLWSSRSGQGPQLAARD